MLSTSTGQRKGDFFHQLYLWAELEQAKHLDI